MGIFVLIGLLIGLVVLVFAGTFVKLAYEELVMRFGKRMANLSAGIAAGALIAFVVFTLVIRAQNMAEIKRMRKESSSISTPLTQEQREQVSRETREKTNRLQYYTEVVKKHKKMYGKDHWCEAERELLRLQLGGD
jgi:mannitol-specific phosphotransferase system IIBC component